jgi:hypothetical protein
VVRDPDVTWWITAELRDVRRDLQMSLGLSPPRSQMGVVIPLPAAHQLKLPMPIRIY